jgi:hypothetical protein
VLLDEGENQGKWRLINELLPMSETPSNEVTASRMLVFTAVGKEGQRVQSLSEEEIKKEIHAKLVRAFR